MSAEAPLFDVTVTRAGRGEHVLRLGDVDSGPVAQTTTGTGLRRREGPYYSITIEPKRGIAVHTRAVPFDHPDFRGFARRKQMAMGLARALAWYIQRAETLGAGPIPILVFAGLGTRDVASLTDEFPITTEPLPASFTGSMDDQKAAEILSVCGLIPRRKKTGPRESLEEHSKRFLTLVNFLFTRDWARSVNRIVPRGLTGAGEIARAFEVATPDMTGHEREESRIGEVCGIVARHRASSSKKDSLTALVAVHIFGGDQEAALKRLEALRATDKRRTNSAGKFVGIKKRDSGDAPQSPTLISGADERREGDATRGKTNLDRGRGRAGTAPAANAEKPSKQGRRPRVREAGPKPRGVLDRGSRKVDRVETPPFDRRPRPRPRRVRRRRP